MKVTFFPRQDYPVEVCKHRYGRKMTYVEQTDTIQEDSATVILGKAIERSIRLGAFIRRNNPPLSDYVMEQYAKGNIRFDYYFPGKQEGNPDQEYTEAEFDTAYNLAAEWFYSLFGRLPSTLSYGFGYTGYKDFAKKYFLAGRNSEFDLGLYDYDNYNIDSWISRPATYRWYDQARVIGIPAALENLSGVIDRAMESGGMVHNFTHWHQMDATNQSSGYSAYDTYFDMLSQKNTDKGIHFCSYGEAVEYLVFRQKVKQAAFYRPLKRQDVLVIRLDVVLDEFTASLLHTPVSVKIDLTGTHLQDKNVNVEGGTLYSRSGNELLLEVPFKNYAEVILRE